MKATLPRKNPVRHGIAQMPATSFYTSESAQVVGARPIRRRTVDAGPQVIALLKLGQEERAGSSDERMFEAAKTTARIYRQGKPRAIDSLALLDTPYRKKSGPRNPLCGFPAEGPCGLKVRLL